MYKINRSTNNVEKLEQRLFKELKIKERTKATIRCVPFSNPQENGTCVLTGAPSKERVLFAKAY